MYVYIYADVFCSVIDFAIEGHVSMCMRTCASDLILGWNNCLCEKSMRLCLLPKGH
jgi:hypothetical protein